MAKRFVPALSALCILLTAACSPLAPPRPFLTPVAPADRLSDAEQIAGEIMAYLLEVVLGRAGALDKREAWATRGRDLPLDFDMVSRRMFGPVPLRAELMVLDTNILGLSRVLYHYDRRLNLFKGTRDHDSLYPCAELMAIRLLLLQKLRRNEKVSIAGLMRHIALFDPESRDAGGAELAAMQLNGAEFRFLKAIFQSEPAFLRYIRHPFIVSTFRKIGVAEPDAFTLAADLAATYHPLSCRPDDRKDIRRATIAIVPAMTAMFETNPPIGPIEPTEAFLSLQEQLRTAIIRKIEVDTADPSAPDRLEFIAPVRPVTLYPGNADRVMAQLCPKADFTVVLLGKNVYRAIYIDPEADISPHKKRIYLDVDDVRYQLVDDEIDAIVTAIRPTLLSGAIRRPRS
jgi:hypothetical protein